MYSSNELGKTVKIHLSALLIFVSYSLTLNAQPNWTFEQVLKLTVEKNPLAESKRSDRAGARSTKSSAIWQHFPSPTVEAFREDGVAKTSGLARLDLPIFSGGQTVAGVKFADQQYRAADSAVSAAELNLALSVIETYADALRQQAKRQFAREGHDKHTFLLESMKRRVTQEVSSLADQHLAEIRTNQAAYDLSLINQQFASVLAQLVQLSGVPESDALLRPTLDERPVGEISDSWTTTGGNFSDLNRVIARAIDYSPELKRLSYEEQAADANIAAKRSVYYPSLLARFEKDFGLSDDERGLLVLSIQPGAGLSSLTEVDAAKARKLSLSQNRDAALRAIRQQVTEDWHGLQGAKMRLEGSANANNLSDAVYQSYKRQYEIGRKSWVEVLNALRELTQSQNSYEDARAQVLVSTLRLKALTGSLMPSSTELKK